MEVACFADEYAPARRLASALGAELRPLRLHHFPDGESLPRTDVPTGNVTVLYRSLDRANRKIVDLMLAADALRRAGARRLILVAPYFCYLRQDAVFSAGESLSRDVIAPLIGARFDAVVTVQAHLHRTHDLALTLKTNARNLDAVDILAAALPPYLAPPLVVGPDAESAPWAQDWALRLGGEGVALTKVRLGDRRVRLEAASFCAAGRAAIVVDDVTSSGRTLEAAVSLLRSAGAASVDVAVVHAMTSPTATARIFAAGARRIVSTDSIRHPTNAADLAPLLAGAVRDMIEAP